MEDNNLNFFYRYKKALSIGASVITAITTIASAGFWISDKIVFKEDLEEIKVEISLDIRRNTLELLKNRLSQEKSNRDLYAGAIRNLSDLEELSVNDIRNLEVFTKSLSDTEDEIDSLNNRIRFLENVLQGAR